MRTILLSVFFISAFMISACTSQSSTSKENTEPKVEAVAEAFNKKVDIPEFKERMEADKTQLIDVRTPEEFADGHIEGAQNINLFDDDFKEQLKANLDPDKQVLVYCKSGARSTRAAKALEELGYKQIYNLKGGYLGWIEK